MLLDIGNHIISISIIKLYYNIYAIWYHSLYHWSVISLARLKDGKFPHRECRCRIRDCSHTDRLPYQFTDANFDVLGVDHSQQTNWY